MTSLERPNFPESLEVVEISSNARSHSSAPRIDYSTPKRDFSTKERILRKYQGILLSFHGSEAPVLFKSGDASYEYYLSASLLRKNGVTIVQQPFELLEGEKTFPDSSVELFNRVIPLAPANSVTSSSITLSPETREELDFIFKELKAVNGE
jgi:hypothetical protein